MTGGLLKHLHYNPINAFSPSVDSAFVVGDLAAFFGIDCFAKMGVEIA